MSHKISAGLMLYRQKDGVTEILIAHPGGPYLRNKDDGYWGIPKGEVEKGEDLLAAAIREFHEETGLTPQGSYLPLGTVTLLSGKTIHAWAFAGDWDGSTPLQSNLFALEWPPKSGHVRYYPEIDRAGFFTLEAARIKVNPAQIPLIDRLEALLREMEAPDKTTNETEAGQ